MGRHVPSDLTEAVRLARWAEHAQKRTKGPSQPGAKPPPATNSGRSPPRNTPRQARPPSVNSSTKPGPCSNCRRPGHDKTTCRLPGSNAHDPSTWVTRPGQPKQGNQSSKNGNKRVTPAQLRSLHASLAAMQHQLTLAHPPPAAAPQPPAPPAGGKN